MNKWLGVGWEYLFWYGGGIATCFYFNWPQDYLTGIAAFLIWTALGYWLFERKPPKPETADEILERFEHERAEEAAALKAGDHKLYSKLCERAWQRGIDAVRRGEL